jgi:twitching motility protein PilI
MEQGQPFRLEADWLPPVAALAHFEPPPGTHLAAPRQAVKREQRARYGFRFDTLGLLIDPTAGSEVMPMPRIAPLPGALSGFVGLANLRGGLVPLYDLRILLDLGPRPAGTEPLALVFGEGDDAVGVLMEEYPTPLTALHPLARADMPAIPAALEHLAPTGYVQDGMVWLEFDHGTFFEALLHRATGATRTTV